MEINNCKGERKAVLEAGSPSVFAFKKLFTVRKRGNDVWHNLKLHTTKMFTYKWKLKTRMNDFQFNLLLFEIKI